MCVRRDLCGATNSVRWTAKTSFSSSSSEWKVGSHKHTLELWPGDLRPRAHWQFLPCISLAHTQGPDPQSSFGIAIWRKHATTAMPVTKNFCQCKRTLGVAGAGAPLIAAVHQRVMGESLHCTRWKPAYLYAIGNAKPRSKLLTNSSLTIILYWQISYCARRL